MRPLYFVLCACLLITLSFLKTAAFAFKAETTDKDLPAIDVAAATPREDATVTQAQIEASGIKGLIPAALRGRPLILQIPSARLHHYDVFLKEDGIWTKQTLANDNETSHFPSRFPRFAIETNDSIYYLRFKDHTLKIPQVQLEDQLQFTSLESMRLFRIGLYYGLAIMSVVFNFVFYLIFKDRRFITYCLLLLTTFISFFYEDGMFYFFSNGRWTLDYLMVWNNSVTALIAIPFTKYFLDLHTFFRKYRAWYLYGSISLLLAALLFTFTDHIIFYATVYILCFLLAGSCIVLAVKQFKQDVYARFLVLAFGLVIVTAILYVLYTHIDSETYHLFDLGTFRLVSALEIISVSFAIIYKVRALQDENEKNRQELDKYLRSIEQVGTLDDPLNTLSAAADPLRETNLEQRISVGDRLKEQYDLTERELEVLLCIWDGLTNKEIADKLFITVSTTKYHIGNLYVKLDVKNRNQVQTLRD
ncbi:7TM diverse intracellular signaling domain-containing protein [Sphingobacterium bambusae]|uniref:7TM diverse intracellular signaling domain-containing protein n=1 Tax=Sphingobacterium bambusae TaxID=662858 RepID=A0ABW6BQL7_9SPHI|nr:7TM diverse intracellular signaling domain-containing protein [Sphingobacterium bambusae]WPL48186.1 7TM diverse intracellular signaling domain-containing protein [Sphingobacterium bambusae]